ncbi:hypothetical protein AMATHDRAFT_77243 [Amanita thiersii Skay4041]|uniref:Ketoreductase (KR) domain-containing protein n=1 Tax=Amanita thiersii Skay4041 TaxID=703135 RepID=A0A2A9NDI8_9AGAR|nr:hypothetical protein AMATHDRAFT_77243 [Amanita thiersii Skay4041]
MVLKILGAIASLLLPSKYAAHFFIGIASLIALHTLSQGRRTNRERDLHGRVILVTGGFTSLGLTILQTLAERGAHIIALTPDPIDSPNVTILISLLRTTTSNGQIYAEQCDLNSPSSIRSFCTRFLTGQDQRLDAILFAHEYQHIGPLQFFSNRRESNDAQAREANSLATFLIITLLLPVLLVAPSDRDIRIINLVNPFYAAAIGKGFHARFGSNWTGGVSRAPLLLAEGTRALRTVVLTRHLQRVLDALPSAQVPKTEEGASTIPVISAKMQKSNIVSVSVCPGISRVDTMASMLNADWTLTMGADTFGAFAYLLLQPFLRVLTKSPTAAMQSVLHALFLPTPFKGLGHVKFTPPGSTTEDGHTADTPVPQTSEEVLKPGSLYRECAVVPLRVPLPVEATQATDSQKRTPETQLGGEAPKEVLNVPDDGELGGELTGRLVWEAYEEALKSWEKADHGRQKEDISPSDSADVS